MTILALDLGTHTGFALLANGVTESGVQVFDVRRGESPKASVRAGFPKVAGIASRARGPLAAAQKDRDLGLQRDSLRVRNDHRRMSLRLR
jgi:hypothetical protein